jgi:beta-fructofuranosidase
VSAPRPGYHFSVPSGWINDPLGVTWHDTPDGGRYELFFQFNPAAPVWAPECRWGQATGRDLVRWAHPRTALEPGPEETGCWSGAVVVPDGEPPVIVYTSVLADSIDLGRVALATGDPDWQQWTPDPSGPVLLAPPDGLDLAVFRDPFLWREGAGWSMAIGAGRSDGRPAVLRFSSPDLRAWRYDGVLAEGSAGAEPGGAAWECPQLFRLDGAWALLVSLWGQGATGVAGAIGDLQDGRFVARRWRRFASAPLYATTTFDDAQGRRCALSWIQEDAPAAGDWAGTLSVPWLLGRDGDRITVAPHPDVDTLRADPLVDGGPRRVGAQPFRIGPVEPYLDITVEAVERPVEVTLAEEDRPLASVVVDPTGGSVRLLVDAGVLEVFSDGAARAQRTAATGEQVTVTVTALSGETDVRLQAHRMARVLS